MVAEGSGWLRSTSEFLVLGLGVVAPWMFGSVEDWAILLLMLGLSLVTLLGLGLPGPRLGDLTCWPSLALLGIIAYGGVQLVPLPEPIAGLLAPSLIAEREALLPDGPTSILGDDGEPVPLPALRLSRTPEATATFVTRLIAAWVLFQCTLRLRPDSRMLGRFGRVLALNAGLLALVATLQWLTWNGSILWLRESPRDDVWYSGGPFFNHNQLGAYLNLGLGFALAWVVDWAHRAGSDRTRTRGLTALPAMVAGLIGLGLVGSHSRGALIATTVALGILVWPAVRMIRPSRGMLAVLAGIPVLMLIYVVVVGGDSPIARVASIPDQFQENPRIDLWGSALQAWTDRPLWGSGLGSFAHAAMPYYPIDDNQLYVRAENEYLDLLVEMGLIGFLLAIFGLVGVIRLSRSALQRPDNLPDQAWHLGAAFGGLTLLVHWLSDFSLHVPGVAVVVWILFGMLCGLGLRAREATAQRQTQREGSARSTRSEQPDRPSPIFGLILVVCAGWASYHAGNRTIAELWRGEAKIPLVVSEVRPAEEPASIPALRRRLEAIDRILVYRPDDPEIHYRRGLTWLGLYRNAVAADLGATMTDPDQLEVAIDPRTAHGLIHVTDAPPSDEEILGTPEIVEFLIPATRGFLQARRLDPLWAAPHAQLAMLDYLIPEEQPEAIHIRRAMRQCGAEAETLIQLGQLAINLGDLELASSCYRRALEAQPGIWDRIVLTVGLSFTPREIFDQIVPATGDLPLRFVDRLYFDPSVPPGPDPPSQVEREALMDEAIQRLGKPTEGSNLTPGDRAALEARGLARLERYQQAVDRMTVAVRLDSRNTRWRADLIRWHLELDQLAEARQILQRGLRLTPDAPELLRLQGRIRALRR